MLILAVFVRPAQGNHIAGATYSGTHDGGGTMEFRVAANGSNIEHFEIVDVPCGAAIVSTSLDFSPASVPIDGNHTFSYTGVGIQRLSFSGSFPAPGQAEGTLRYQQSSIPFVQGACDSGSLNWTASTSAPPPTASPTLPPTETPTLPPSETPTTSPTLSPTQTPSPTATLPPDQKLWGDSDCSGGITTRDNQALLRNILAQPPLSQTPPCFGLGSEVTADSDPHVWGDWDCSGSISIRDNQALLRYILEQPPLSQAQPCPVIGDAADVQ
jgi:hypothetical protein